MMPTLVYDETCPYNGSLGFDQFCGMSLPLHEALKTLNIKLVNYYDDTLLFPNIRCSTLLEMTINIVNSYSRIRLPNNFKAFKTLLVLKLHSPIDLDVVDSPVCFPSLKSLHLTSVKFELKDSGVGDVLMFTISVPSLQRLSITKDSVNHCPNDPRFEINTPSLKYLKIVVDRVGSYSFVDDMPKLVEANVSVCESETGKLMKVLTSLEHLSLSLHPSMASHLKGTSNLQTDSSTGTTYLQHNSAESAYASA